MEEVLVAEASVNSRLFRYVVWNYTSEKKRDVEYAIGEIASAQLGEDSTRVTWTYRYVLKSGLGVAQRQSFEEDFLDTALPIWMRSQLERARSFAEALP